MKIDKRSFSVCYPCAVTCIFSTWNLLGHIHWDFAQVSFYFSLKALSLPFRGFKLGTHLWNLSIHRVFLITIMHQYWKRSIIYSDRGLPFTSMFILITIFYTDHYLLAYGPEQNPCETTMFSRTWDDPPSRAENHLRKGSSHH